MQLDVEKIYFFPIPPYSMQYLTASRIVFQFFPALNDLRSLDDYLFARCCLVGNSLCIGRTTTWRIDPLAVNPLVYRNRIAWLSHIRGFLNSQERFLQWTLIESLPCLATWYSIAKPSTLTPESRHSTIAEITISTVQDNQNGQFNSCESKIPPA